MAKAPRLLEDAPKKEPRLLTAEDIVSFGPSSVTAKGAARAAAVGGAEGALGAPGDILSLIGLAPQERLTPGQQAVEEAAFENQELLPFIGDDEFGPRYAHLPTSRDVTGLLSLLGVQTEPQNLPERIAQRVGQNVGAGAITGAGAGGLSALGAAGVGGQLAEEQFGPLAGLLAELGLLGGIGGLGALKGGIAVGEAEKPLLETARRTGAAEKDVAQLFKGKTGKGLTTAVGRGRKASTAMTERLQEGLGNYYEVLKEEGKALGTLSPGERKAFNRGLAKVEKKLSGALKGSEREKVLKAVEDLQSKAASGDLRPDQIIEYWKDVNSMVNWNSLSGGKKRLAEVKSVFTQALEDASPEFAQEFQRTNELYSRFKDLQKAIKPTHQNEWMQAAVKAPIVWDLLSLNFGGAIKKSKALTGFGLSRSAAEKFMLSSRSQGTLRKAAQLVNKGRTAEAAALLQRLEKDFLSLKEEPTQKSQKTGEPSKKEDTL